MADVATVIEERKHSHGEFNDTSEISQKLKAVVFQNRARLGFDLSYAQAEALDMIFHKISRIIAGDPNFADHWVDIAGYAILAADRCQQVKP